jgi:hypothetical protein
VFNGTPRSALVEARCSLPAVADPSRAAANVRFETLAPDGTWQHDASQGAGRAFTSLGRLGARRRLVASWREPELGVVVVVREFDSPTAAPSPRVLDLGELEAPDSEPCQVRLIPSRPMPAAAVTRPAAGRSSQFAATDLDAERARVLHRSRVRIELDGPLDAPSRVRARHVFDVRPGPLDRLVGLRTGRYRARLVSARLHESDAPKWLVRGAPSSPEALAEAAFGESPSSTARSARSAPTQVAPASAPASHDSIVTIPSNGGTVDVALEVVPGAQVDIGGMGSRARLTWLRATDVATDVEHAPPVAAGPDLDGTVALALPEGTWDLRCAFDAEGAHGSPRRARVRVTVQQGRRASEVLAWEEVEPEPSRGSRRAPALALVAALLVAGVAYWVGRTSGVVTERGLVPVAIELPDALEPEDMPRWMRLIAIDRSGDRVRLLHDGRVDESRSGTIELPYGSWEVVAFAGRSLIEPSLREAVSRTFVASVSFDVTSATSPEQRLVLEPAALAVVGAGGAYALADWPPAARALWPLGRVEDRDARIQPLFPNLAHVALDGSSRVRAGAGRAVGTRTSHLRR